MTPEMALRMRVFLEALRAALTGLFPWSRSLERAFAKAFAWLDQAAIAVPPVVEVAVADAALVSRARRIRARTVRSRAATRRAVGNVAAQRIGFMPGQRARTRAMPSACKPRTAAIQQRAIFAKS